MDLRNLGRSSLSSRIHTGSHRNHPHAHKNKTKQIKTGVRPSLHLFAPGEEKEPSETVSVASWTAESMLEFLLDSLPAPATKTSGGSDKEEGDGGAGSHEEL